MDLKTVECSGSQKLSTIIIRFSVYSNDQLKKKIDNAKIRVVKLKKVSEENKIRITFKTNNFYTEILDE